MGRVLPADRTSAPFVRTLLVTAGESSATVDHALATLAALASGRRPAIHLESTPVTTLAARIASRSGDASADVIVIDGRAPEASVVVAEAHRLMPDTPILLLGSSESRVTACIAAGASDFAADGASSAELALRIRLLAAGAVRVAPRSRAIGALLLDRETRRLSHDGQTVTLSPIEVKLLERLLQQPGKPVSRADLQRSIWPEEEVDQQPTNIAVVYVSYVRAKLAKLGGGCAIRTITNVGYVFDLEPSPLPSRTSRLTR